MIKEGLVSFQCLLRCTALGSARACGAHTWSPPHACERVLRACAHVCLAEEARARRPLLPRPRLRCVLRTRWPTHAPHALPTLTLTLPPPRSAPSAAPPVSLPVQPTVVPLAGHTVNVWGDKLVIVGGHVKVRPPAALGGVHTWGGPCVHARGGLHVPVWGSLCVHVWGCSSGVYMICVHVQGWTFGVCACVCVYVCVGVCMCVCDRVWGGCALDCCGGWSCMGERV